MNHKKASSDRAGVNTIVGVDSELDGHFAICDGIRVDGILRGSLNAAGMLVVGPTGTVCANPIRVQCAVIAGHVEGNIQAEGEVRLDASATVVGNISGSVLIIAQGASLQGMCDVGDVGELSVPPTELRQVAGH
jgi:cytoskeletal protein CcmA (bactofilin family)